MNNTLTKEQKNTIYNKVLLVAEDLRELSFETNEFEDIAQWKKTTSENIDHIEDDCVMIRLMFQELFKDFGLEYSYGVIGNWYEGCSDKHLLRVFAFENERLLRNLNAFNYTILKKIDETKPEQYDNNYIKKRACDWLDYLAHRLYTNILIHLIK